MAPGMLCGLFPETPFRSSLRGLLLPGMRSPFPDWTAQKNAAEIAVRAPEVIASLERAVAERNVLDAEARKLREKLAASEIAGLEYALNYRRIA